MPSTAINHLKSLKSAMLRAKHVSATCEEGHILVYTDSRSGDDSKKDDGDTYTNGWACNICKTEVKDTTIKSHHCAKCKYNLCDKCNTEQMNKQKKNLNCKKGHKLKLKKSNNINMKCDECLQFLRYSAAVYGCHICDYYLCKYCHDYAAKQQYQCYQESIPNPSDPMQSISHISANNSRNTSNMCNNRKRTRNAIDLTDNDNTTTSSASPSTISTLSVISPPSSKKQRNDDPEQIDPMAVSSQHIDYEHDDDMNKFLNTQKQQMLQFMNMKYRMTNIDEANKKLKAENESLRSSLDVFRNDNIKIQSTNIRLQEVIDEYKQENEELKQRLIALETEEISDDNNESMHDIEIINSADIAMDAISSTNFDFEQCTNSMDILLEGTMPTIGSL